MPQEKKISINYRAFLTCDDPRGVVECQAIRKSDVISPQKREQIKKEKRSKTLAVLIEEEKKEVSIGGGEIRSELEEQAPSLELNIYNVKKGHKKHIAKDLLRGAFDLQESFGLVNGLKKARFMGVEEEKPWFSSRKSLDDMKKIVRNSLLRQFAITNPVFEHNIDERKQLGSPDMASSSSSQSSLVYSSNFAPSDFSSISSSSSLGKMGKSSSLIVKLMGLESLPSSTVRHRESEKMLNLSKPVYDIVSPRARKAVFGAQESTQEVVEALKIKELLKSSNVHRLMPNSKVIVPKLEGNKESVIKVSFRRGSPRENMNSSVKKLDSSKAKASAKLNKKTQKKQEAVKKVSEIVKVKPSPRKGEEKKVTELRSRDQPKLTQSRNRKPNDGILISKNQYSIQRRTASDAILDHKSRKTYKHENNDQPVLSGDNHRSKGEIEGIQVVYGEKINAVQITECDMEDQISLSGPQEDVSVDTTDDGNENNPNDKQSSVFDITSTSEHCHPEIMLVKSSHTFRETDSETFRKSLTRRTTKLKALILNDPSFVRRAEELFDLQVKPISIPRINEENDHNNVAYSKLLQDCATEVMELKSLQLSQACLPFPRSYKPHPRNAIFLDRLLEEICNGIDDFKGYLSPTTDMLVSDTLHSLIDQDLRFKSGTWVIGWRNEFEQDQVEQVVGEIDRLILGKLIEEILVDFILL